VATLFTIPLQTKGHLYMTPAPLSKSLEHVIIEWKEKAGVATVVSMLPIDESIALGLKNEQSLTEKMGLKFINHAVTDFSIPTETAAFTALALALAEQLNQGKAVLIHCRGGIGRSGLLCAAIGHCLGFSMQDALACISSARGCSVPETEEQKTWLRTTIFES